MEQTALPVMIARSRSRPISQNAQPPSAIIAPRFLADVVCANGAFVAVSGACPAGSTSTGGPLIFYLQHAASSGPTTDATGASDIANEDYALFIQDKWQIRPNFTLNYGLRWEAQILPEMTIAPSQTA